MRNALTLMLLLVAVGSSTFAQQSNEHSVARVWMDAHLKAIRQDGLGPTIHSRNLFQFAVGMYDAWAVYYPKKGDTYFLGKTVGDYHCEFEGFEIPENRDSALNVTIQYAAYRLINLRFNEYSSKTRMMDDIIALWSSTGYDEGYTSTDYKNGSAAALGNYIAMKIYDFALSEPAGDADGYDGPTYNPINSNLYPNRPGSQGLQNKNRWQPLDLVQYVNEKGWDSTLLDWNAQLVNNQDIFLTPHWGLVTPFSMDKADQKVMVRDGQEFIVYNDPGPPPLMSPEKDIENSDAYKWNFELVSVWSSHNDPNDETIIDMSPGTIGTTRGMLPTKYSDYPAFFDLMNGGTKTKAERINPKTGKPYEKNLVKRGDYTRVIAEFWVDGVNTETPPGHWIKTLNEVNDHPDFEKKWGGKGKVLSDLEWDVKAYLTLTGGLHDAGISAWSIKAYYDYIRPISALRWMSDNGQSSDKALPRYHPEGIELIPGKIELVKKGDPLAGENGEHINKIKLYTWKGPDYIDFPATEYAGVGWILAENWWPYQRYAFATPPFAGYVSGHSTFSTAASEILTRMTGDPYFPGGLAIHRFKKNEFLQFEDGPSEDIELQWATYREASDETCLSRIWGGIHPPADDIQGRIVGEKVGKKAYEKANTYFK